MIKNLWLRYKELFFYAVFGVGATVINIVSYRVLANTFGKKYFLIANIIAWILAFIFAFITNKIWVFKSKNKTKKETTKEIINFLIARVATLFVEVFLMWLMVDQLHHDKLIWKLLCNVITVVLNYLFSRLFVFKNSHLSKK